ncbi:hypothetical protein YN1_1320 [Nanoarchaeota archaeon]
MLKLKTKDKEQIVNKIKSDTAKLLIPLILLIFQNFIASLVTFYTISYNNIIINNNNNILPNSAQNIIIRESPSTYINVGNIILANLGLLSISLIFIMIIFSALFEWFYSWNESFKILRSAGYDVKKGRLGFILVLIGMLIIVSTLGLLMIHTQSNYTYINLSLSFRYLISISPILQYFYIGDILTPMLIGIILSTIGEIISYSMIKKLFKNKLVRTGSILSIIGFIITIFVSIPGFILIFIASVLIYTGLRKVETKLKRKVQT